MIVFFLLDNSPDPRSLFLFFLVSSMMKLLIFSIAVLIAVSPPKSITGTFSRGEEELKRYGRTSNVSLPYT